MALKRRKTLGAGLFLLLAIAAAVALLVSYLAPFLHPVRNPLVMFFGLYFVPLVLFNLFLLLIAIFKFRRLLLIPVIALLPTLLLADRFVKFGHEETVPEGPSIRVLTYNVGRYNAGNRKVTVNESVSGIRQFIAQQDADIVCLQEFAVADTAALAPYLPEYPYRAKHLFKGNRYFGNITLSKYPIRHIESLTFPQSRNLCLITDIDCAGKMLRVYNCHLESSSISFPVVLKRLFRKNHFSEEVAQVHGRLREATRRRTEQVSALLESEAGSHYPSLVCGDFNDTPISYTYRQLTRTKKDGFVEAGTGFSSTYAVLWPMLRIDYILIPQTFSAVRHEITRAPWSDHYPVKTDIILDQTKQ